MVGFVTRALIPFVRSPLMTQSPPKGPTFKYLSIKTKQIYFFNQIPREKAKEVIKDGQRNGHLRRITADLNTN